MVIDMHAHILPGMDDGSDSVQTSFQMLHKMQTDGIDAVVATPHFRIWEESVSDFSERRSRATQQLGKACLSPHPSIFLGAEVAYSSKLRQLKNLRDLCIEGTDTLLLEMPLSQWGNTEADFISHLALDEGLHVVLAHLERGLPFQKDRAVLDSILLLPIYVQINANALLRFPHRKKFARMFEDGTAHLLGSDSHNMSTRMPNLVGARKVLRRLTDETVLERIDRCGELLLKGTKESK